MNKLFTTLAIIFLALPHFSFAQKIEIGDDADKVNTLVNWLVNDHNRVDSYGHTSSSYWEYDAKFYDGSISDVIQCCSNQYLYDFQVVADFCKHYMMERGKLAYIITQYSNLSTDKLKSSFERTHEGRTFDNYYFTEDFNHYSRIYLATNGNATVEYRATDLSALPKTIHDRIQTYFRDRDEAETKKREAQAQEEARRREAEANAEIRRQQEEAEQLRLFLIERKNKIYDYKELNPQDYQSFKNGIEQKIKSALYDYKNINYNATITFNIDTSNSIKYKIQNTKSDNPTFDNFLNAQLKNVKLNNSTKNNYSVSSSFDYSLTVKNLTDTFSFEKTSSDLVLSKGNANRFEESKQYVQSDLNSKSLPTGKYVIAYSKNQVNDNVNENVKYIMYKGFGGGSANCLFSVLIPGLGNPFVNKTNKATWLITTVGVAGLIGGGVLMNNLSNSNYQKYQNAKNQNDIDNFYDKANSQHHLMYAFIGAGAAWWAIDIIHVCSKGAKNKRKINEDRSKMNLALYPSIQNNSFALGINVKF